MVVVAVGIVVGLVFAVGIVVVAVGIVVGIVVEARDQMFIEVVGLLVGAVRMVVVVVGMVVEMKGLIAAKL
ncbi:hypothetical protein Pmani_033466 [Petrolisthes manimaculis]|uniref:Uncharacterized protein n=1 Tax=Petrolisthes manimaculis TaxID=1843537 RepID=A0AAE1TSL8_9EUCA|nr:hypothetical protein Pmani_033466 [Petrolisthes manimaculis]